MLTRNWKYEKEAVKKMEKRTAGENIASLTF